MSESTQGRKELTAKYLDLIEAESDRGAVLVAASLLERILEELILQRLVVADKKKDPLFDSPTSPLSTFAAKIEMAYRLGIIWIEVKDMLTSFKRLRNDFAHSPEVASLENKATKDRVKAIFAKEHYLYGFISEKLSEAATRAIPDELERKGVTSLEYVQNHTDVRLLFNFVFATLASVLVNFPEYPGRIREQRIQKRED